MPLTTLPITFFSDKLCFAAQSPRFRKIVKDTYGDRETFYGGEKPTFRFTRREGEGA